jgi:hypothetical protein
MATEDSSVRRAESRTLKRRLLPFALVVPLVAVPTVAALVAFGGSGSRLQVAEGSAGGVFHPIAGTFVADDTRLESCGTDPACLEQAFGNLSFRDGPKPTLVLYERKLETDPAVEKDCHRIAHFIGSAALERFHGNVAETFAQGSSACVSGYYHGILERAFLGITNKAGLARKARSLCLADGIRRRGFLDYQCRHGLGHGLMIQSGYDLPLALDICAGIGTGWDRKACASGAFMENINTAFGYRSAWLDDKDPLYPCARVRAFDERSCYLRASWRILVLAGGSFEKTAERCEQLGRWAQTCLQGYGRDAAEYARYVVAKIRPLCRLAAAGEGDCLRGAARTIANASGAPGIAQARPLCVGAPAHFRANCFGGIGLVLGMLHPTRVAREHACRRLTAAYASSCLSAAEDEVDPSGARAWG